MQTHNRGNAAGAVALVAIARDKPRRTIARALAGVSWRVSSATDGQEAVSVALAELPELIVVGSELPPLPDGTHAATAIVNSGPRGYRPRLVLVVASHDAATRELAAVTRAERVVVVPHETVGAPQPEPPPADSGARRQLQGRELWIVDDSQAIRMLVRHAFEREGWRVREFEDLSSAHAVAASEAPAAIVLDIHLPDGNGLDHVRRFATTGAAILIVSNSSGAQQVERAFTAGAADLIAKPFDLRSLVARVTRAVQQTPPAVVTKDVVPVDGLLIGGHEPSVVVTHWG